MGRISEYPVAAAPILGDKLVGTKIGGNPVDSTFNFTIAELLALISSNLTAASFTISGVTEYADNAAAITGGLNVGQVYRTGDLLKIVH
jgi:hypothetical protein